MLYVNVPGMYNSGESHWQTQWEKLFPDRFLRVQQKNWSTPLLDEWVEGLQATLATIATLDEPIVLVGHSLGCIALAHWANGSSSLSQIAGALLVAPVDVEKASRECLQSFNPVPKIKFSFPSVVVASTNDPYASMENAARLAAWWGSRFICVGDRGHINAQSGLGQWQEGLTFLSTLEKIHAQKTQLHLQLS